MKFLSLLFVPVLFVACDSSSPRVSEGLTPDPTPILRGDFQGRWISGDLDRMEIVEINATEALVASTIPGLEGLGAIQGDSLLGMSDPWFIQFEGRRAFVRGLTEPFFQVSR